MKSIIKTIMIIITFLFINSIQAQEVTENNNEEKKDKNPVEMKEVVVTATRTEIKKRETGKSITVITGEELEKRGKSTVADALNDVPGLTITRNSELGGSSSVYIRGSKEGKILVMIDGVEVNDPIQPGRSFDFAHLTTDNIERIEIIRGAQSTLYGSDAMGGVINIITKKGEGEPQLNISLEGGSYSTFRESLSILGGNEKSNFSFLMSHLHSTGYSKAKKPEGSTERYDNDAYKNTTVSSRFGINAFDNAWLNLYFRYINADTETDDGAFQDDPNRTNHNENMNTKFEIKHPILKWWDYSMGFSYMEKKRTYRDKQDIVDTTEDDYSSYTGKIKKFEFQNNFKILDIDVITIGTETEQEGGEFDSYSPSYTSNIEKHNVKTISYFAQNHLKLFKRIYLTLGGRIDDHDEYGIKKTTSASSSFIIPVTETQIKGSFGTGFKSPTIYQLYDTMYGNKDLEPEESKSVDFGFEQGLNKDRVVFGATYFFNEYKNMIKWETTGPMTWQYLNVDRAESKGVELELSINPTDYLSMSYVHTYQKTEDKDSGKELYNIPKNQGSINVNLILLKKLSLNLNIIYVDRQKIQDFTSYPYQDDTLPSYYKYDFFASYEINKTFKIFGKIINIFNEDYQVVNGYATPGRSYYGGAKATF